MHRFILFCSVCLILTNAADITSESDAKVLKQEYTNDGAGNYKFSFETTNGIIRNEVGHLVNIGEENEHMVVEGSYSYIDENGKHITVNYRADENGYKIRPPLVFQDIPPPSVDGNIVATLLGK